MLCCLLISLAKFVPGIENLEVWALREKRELDVFLCCLMMSGSF